jgi:hypothetical protein
MVKIYQWGSRYGGNDWCFVRLPANYAVSNRPHELVVLNHGNGWVMDGTEAKANFSEKTQFGVDGQNGGTYRDESRPDFVRYSSPLIEALLKKGYVVAGAQNDGQHYGFSNAGYGNDETRQNVVDFVDHLQRSFNLTRYCHFVGASNGALASLGAAMLMPPGAVRSITLLYPLVSLSYAWLNSHTDGVDAAYPEISQATMAGFNEATRGNDPLSYMVTRSQLVSWTNESLMLTDSMLAGTLYKSTSFPWPRIYGIYSLDDVVTPAVEHWEKLRKLLLRSFCKNKELQVAGAHGSWQHFDVGSILEWMER